jgi:hypothetical protein
VFGYVRFSVTVVTVTYVLFLSHYLLCARLILSDFLYFTRRFTLSIIIIILLRVSHYISFFIHHTHYTSSGLLPSVTDIFTCSNLSCSSVYSIHLLAFNPLPCCVIWRSIQSPLALYVGVSYGWSLNSSSEAHNK